MISVSATATTRYRITAQYVAGAVLLGKRAAEIELLPTLAPLQIAEHRALVVAAVMQSAAAMESELAEITMWGPGHHLGSNPTATEGAAFLAPVAKAVDSVSGVLEKRSLVLHLLRKPGFDRGRWPYQDADLLVKLRNALVHYESTSGGTTTPAKLVEGLRAKGFARPPFVSDLPNEFPQKVLGAACAAWAAETAAEFLDTAYDFLGVPGVLDANRAAGAEFRTTLPPKKTP